MRIMFKFGTNFSFNRFCDIYINYSKNPKNSNIRKYCSSYPKIGMLPFYYRLMGSKDANGMANSVDPDQTAPLGSGSTLFAQTFLTEN